MKINGFTLKAITKFKGHEGEPCYQGNIYLSNKKVGYFSSSYTMGPMDIIFDSPEIEQQFIATAVAFDKAYPMGFLYYNAPFKLNPNYQAVITSVDAEDLILEMLAIDEAEKTFKKNQRAFCPILIYTYGAKGTNAYGLTRHVTKEEAAEIFKEKNEEIILFADSLKVFEIEV